MKKNDLIKSSGSIFRVLERKGDKAFVIDCVKRTMPRWTEWSSLYGYESCTEEELLNTTGMNIPGIDELDAKSKRFIREHFTLIAPILPFV